LDRNRSLPAGSPQLDPDRGFLPKTDPLSRLPAAFDPWEEVAAELPKLLAAGSLRRRAEALPLLDPSPLAPAPQLRRAAVLLSFLGHAFVWGGKEVEPRVPRGIAVPWVKVSAKLGLPPVLTYATYVLWNWRRLDPEAPVGLGNAVLLQNFLGGLDEEWFALVHVDIEARAAAPLRALGSVGEAASRTDVEEAEQHLGTLARALEPVYASFVRMPEGCDPYIYYRRVRPYLAGWEGSPPLAEGILYEGVRAFGGRPRRFRGATGAQNALIYSLDAGLGIQHGRDPLQAYLLDLRNYMPPEHRAFLEAVERGPSVRTLALAHRTSRPSLRAAYNACVEWLERFRARHLGYVENYIQRQARGQDARPGHLGTGGTPYEEYLRKHLQETREHRIA
jgi:indoleamine 2,3-dioxygenase